MFYAFDLLHLDGTDLTGQPLLKRRARLARLLDGSGLMPSQELPGAVSAIVDAVRDLVLEGVVAKRKDSLYEPGERSDAWQKLKLENHQEFVIGGYRPDGRTGSMLYSSDTTTTRACGSPAESWLRAPSASRGQQGAEAAPCR